MARDIEKRRATAKRFYQRHKDRVKAEVAARRKPYSRWTEAQRRRATELKTQYRRARGINPKAHLCSARQAEYAAASAWKWWLFTCPDTWHRSYWDAAGKPWRGRGLTPRQKWALRYRNDPKFALRNTIKRWMNRKVKGLRISRKWGAIVGYTPAELKRHIERQFIDGMHWKNYGQWHIDHITPVAAFEFKSIDDPAFKHCFELANLRPLWAKDNQKKAARRTMLI